MNNRITIERNRAIGSGSKAVENPQAGFDGLTMRAPGIAGASIPTGSIVKIDTDWRDSLTDQPIAGAKNEDGSQRFARHLYVHATSGKAYPFYPTQFWKSQRSYSRNGEMAVAGDFVNAGGTVLNDLDSFSTVDEALDFIAQQCANGKSVKITQKQIETMPFGKRESLEAKDLKKAYIPSFDWVDDTPQA